MNNGYIYVIKVLDYYKIGKTKDIKTRIGEYTKLMENPEIVMCYYVHNYHYIEKYLHEKYKDRNTRGEWFKLEKCDINYINDFLKFNRVLNDKEKLSQFNELLNALHLGSLKIIKTENDTYKFKEIDFEVNKLNNDLLKFENDDIDVVINKMIQFIMKRIYRIDDILL